MGLMGTVEVTVWTELIKICKLVETTINNEQNKFFFLNWTFKNKFRKNSDRYEKTITVKSLITDVSP